MITRSSLYSNNRKEDRIDFISTRDSSNKQEDSSIHRRSRHEILFPSLRKNHHDNYHHINLRYKSSIDVSPTSATESENYIHDKVHQQRLPPHDDGIKMK